MLKYLNKAAHIMAIASIVNLTVYDIAVAQNMTVNQGKNAANKNTFKPDVSDLFTGTGNNIDIGGTNQTLNPNTMFGGSSAVAPGQNQLPSAVDYEDLYTARDQQINNMSQAQGNFSTIEQDALDVLLGSQGVSSVRGKTFLDLSIDILTDDEATDEFGDCIQEVVVGTDDYDYDDTRVEYCERSHVDIPPILANRGYLAPQQNVQYSNGTCTVAGKSILTDNRATCVRLAAFAVIPQSAIRAVGCSPTGPANGCVTFIYNWQSQTNDKGQVKDQIKFSSNVLAPKVQFEITSSYAGLSNKPMNFRIYVDGAAINGNQRTGNHRAKAIQDAPNALHSFYWTRGLKPAEAVTNGTCPKNCITVIQPIGSTGQSQPASTTTMNVGGFGYGAGIFGSPGNIYGNKPLHNYWSGNTIRTRSSFKTNPFTNKLNGTRVFALEPWKRVFSDSRHYYYSSPLKVVDVARNGLRGVRLRVEFQEKAFADWAYNTDNFLQLEQMVQAGICRAEYEVLDNAPLISGTNCVAAAAGNDIQTTSSGITGSYCGTDIPIAPFIDSPSRRATNLKITPICDANGAYDSTSNCGKYENDADCVKTGETCIEETNGTCNVYEEQWSCGTTTTYTTPTVQTIDVCDSDLTCMGGNCFPDTSESGAQSLADAVAKLTAVDMIASDMTCTPGTDPTSTTGQDECEVFVGEDQRCRRVVLGLADCCETPDGVSMVDYIQLAFAMSKLNKVVTGAGYTNAFTSAWSSLENLGRNSWSSLTRPLTEVWDSIIGNSQVTKNLTGQAAEGLLATVKQEIMKKAAEWVAQIFGEQAANVLFMNAATGGAAVSGGVTTGPIAFSSSVQTVMNAVTIAFTIYTVINLLADILFACENEELELGVSRAIKATHEVGTYCSNRFIICTIRKTTYCKFSSPLSRILNEQIRKQLGIGWGEPEWPDCRGFTLDEINAVDMEKIDLSEWTGMLVSTGMVSSNKANVEDMTGQNSTLGKATEDLFPRENAVDRSQNKIGGINQTDLLDDATTDFGGGLVTN